MTLHRVATGTRTSVTAAFLLVALLTVSTKATCQTQQSTPCYGCVLSGGQAAAILVGAAAVVAGAGVGVYFAVRPSRVTGCIHEEGISATLQEKSGKVYALHGRTDLVHAGTQVKLIARKGKDSNQHPLLDVKRIGKVYGPCSASIATASP